MIDTVDDRVHETDASDAAEAAVVVRNGRGQHSVWRANEPVPGGWEVVGEPATKLDCLARIPSLWLDITPGSPTATPHP